MFTVRVTKADIEDRLDAGFYHPQSLQVARTLRARGALQFDSMVAGVNCGPFGANAIADDLYEEVGIPFIRPVNISGCTFNTGDGLVKVTEDKLRKWGLKIYEGENVFFGRVGDPSVAFIKGKVSISPNIIIAIGSPKGADCGFLYAFCSGAYGLSQLERGLKQVTQPTTSTSSVRSIWVPCLAKTSQTYIGDKVRQAEQARDLSRALDSSVAEKFKFLTSSLNPQKKAWWAPDKLLDSYRINAPHYDAVVLDMLDKAAGTVDLVPLRSLLGSRGMAGGATPLGATYQSDGTFFVRVQNVKPYRLDLADAVYIDPNSDHELRRSRCSEGDVILTITGYPGTASVVMADDLPLNINQHSVRLNIEGDLTPEFVAAAINSPFLKKQVDRLAIGGTREALDYPSVGSLQIPILPEEDREEITRSVNISNRSVRASTRLTTAAKLLVDALIEGQVTESDLIAAQEALDRGDTSLDRALLSRLTRKGIDAPGEPPLFPDLDALYELLQPREEATV